MKKICSHLFAAIFVWALSVGSGQANSQVIVLEDIAKVDVLPGWRTDGGTHMAAIRIQLAPGWKTYWRAPGDAGIPPQFSWAGSQNLTAVQLHWPTPKAFLQNGLRSIGYSEQVIIPLELTPNAVGDLIRLRGEVQLGVCEEICLPMNIDLVADLTPTRQSDPAIVNSLNDQPITAKAAGVRSVICVIDPIADGLKVTAQIVVPKQGSNDIAIMEFSDQTVWVSEAVTTRRGNTLSISSDMVPPNAAPFLMDRSEIRITILGDRRAIDVQGCPAS